MINNELDPTFDPDLANYIFWYCSGFMTEEETQANKSLIYLSKTSHNPNMQASAKQKGWISDDPKILAMIADGFEPFKAKVVSRIWQEHRHALRLNLCPQCNRITRTPQARQCRFCLHDWH